MLATTGINTPLEGMAWSQDRAAATLALFDRVGPPVEVALVLPVRRQPLRKATTASISTPPAAAA